jgi:hypothetical protein
MGSSEKSGDGSRAAVEALREVLSGVITGEGPTTRGRVHFSRMLDAEDAALCEQILLEGGRDGAAVSRAEAEVLLDIDAAATERADQGQFDELLAKAIAHYVLATAGQEVPPRDIALARQTPLAAWAFRQSRLDVDRELAAWITSQVNGRRRLNAAVAAIVALLCGAATSPVSQSIANLLDFGA